MNTQSSPRAIDNGLYQLYTDIQLHEVENDVTMSLNEKEQLKTILLSIKEIDGNIWYPIFQEIVQNPMGHGTVNDLEPLVAYTQSIEQEVLDTAIAESITVVPEVHQTYESTTDQTYESTADQTSITKSISRTNRNQEASVENRSANTNCCTQSTGDHNESIESHAAMNSTLSAVNDTHTPQPETVHTRTEQRTITLISLASVKDTDFTEKSLDKILLPYPRKEMQNIKAHPQQSSAIFRMRMKAINKPKSAKEKAFLDNFDVRDVMQIYRKPMNEFISLLSYGYQSKLNKCRQMLCAYQIGKITDQLLRESSHEDKNKLERSLFHHLRVAIKKNRFKYHHFVNLCVNSLHLAEHAGVHSLFVPEVISPAVLREMDACSLVSLAKHLVEEWPPQFRKLARVTYYGEVVVSRSHTDDMMKESEGAFPGSFLSRF